MVSTMPTERVVTSNSPPRPRSNLSFFLNKPHDVKFAQVPIPQLPTPNHVVVAINYTGICGSDIHYWDHGRIGQFVLQEPMILGHESSGTVVEVGDSVTSLKTGDRVAIEPGYPCRYCHNCLAGRYNLCDKMAFAATPPHHGTLTGFWVAPFDFCYKLPQTVSLQEGALIEPLAVSVHIIRQAQVTPGNSVVIMGTGPIGLLCGAVSKAFGARKIIGVDIVQSKLKFAEGLGFTHTYLSKRISAEDNAMAILDSGDLGQGADVVIDASGAETSIQTSLHVVKAGGVYVQGGMGKADITFPIMAMCQKEVTVKGSFRYGPGDYELAIELVSSNRVPVNKLISDVVDFCQAEEAFKKAKEGQFVKVLIAGPNEPKQAKGLDSLSQESIYA